MDTSSGRGEGEAKDGRLDLKMGTSYPLDLQRHSHKLNPPPKEGCRNTNERDCY